MLKEIDLLKNEPIYIEIKNAYKQVHSKYIKSNDDFFERYICEELIEIWKLFAKSQQSLENLMGWLINYSDEYINQILSIENSVECSCLKTMHESYRTQYKTYLKELYSKISSTILAYNIINKDEMVQSIPKKPLISKTPSNNNFNNKSTAKAQIPQTVFKTYSININDSNSLQQYNYYMELYTCVKLANLIKNLIDIKMKQFNQYYDNELISQHSNYNQSVEKLSSQFLSNRKCVLNKEMSLFSFISTEEKIINQFINNDLNFFDVFLHNYGRICVDIGQYEEYENFNNLCGELLSTFNKNSNFTNDVYENTQYFWTPFDNTEFLDNRYTALKKILDCEENEKREETLLILDNEYNKLKQQKHQ